MDWNRAVIWLLRVVWVSMPFAAGPALAAALDGRSNPVRSTASVALWAGWAVVVVATLVLHPIALTTLRLGVPAALAGVAAAAAAGEPSALAVAVAGIATVVAFSATVGQAFVDGPAYANERRFPLKVPAPLIAGPLAVSWAIVVGGPTAGVLLVAAGRTGAGVVVLIAAIPMAVVLFRALYGLARRWVVFVPAGLVIHDPMTLADPVLFRRQSISSLRPSPQSAEDVLDLTHRASGLGLVLELSEPAIVALVRPGRRQTAEEKAVRRIRFAPTRPGAVLAEAAARRIRAS